MVGTQDQVVLARRHIEVASQVLVEAADALRTVARHLEAGAEPRAVDFSGLGGDVAAGTASERLTALAENRDAVTSELEAVLRELDVADEREQHASVVATAAMRELGATEARAARDHAYRAASEARATLAVSQERSAQLTARAASLRRDLELVTARLDELRAQARELSAARTTDVPVRELALDALDEIEVPAPSNLLSRYIAARFGREVKSSRWGPLRADERQAFQREDEAGRATRVWLQPALDDKGREQTRLWVRSDWEEARRTVPDPADLTLLTTRVCYLAELAVDPPQDAADAQGLRLVAVAEAERAHMFPGHDQTEHEFLEDLAQSAHYTRWPAPPPPTVSDEDVPF